MLPAETAERLLARSDGLTTAALAERAGVSRDQVRSLLRELEGAGRVRRAGQRRATRWHAVTDEDRIRERAAELAARSGRRGSYIQPSGNAERGRSQDHIQHSALAASALPSVASAAGPAVEDPRAACRNDVVVAAPPRDDPYKSFNFRVEIEGIALAAFTEVDCLESETAVIEYRVGGEPHTVRKLPGLTKYSNIVLRRGITQDAELWSWRKNIIEGKADRRDGAIVLLDDEGNDVVRWNFSRGWICKWEGPALNAQGNEVAIETIAIAHEGLERG